MNGVNHYELLQCNSSALQHWREQQDSVASTGFIHYPEKCINPY